MDIKEFLGEKVCYVDEGSLIRTHKLGQPVASIQNLHNDSITGAVEEGKAMVSQDQIGQFIADAINEKLSGKMHQLTMVYGGGAGIGGTIFASKDAAIEHLAKEGFFPDEEFEHHYHHRAQPEYYVIHVINRG